MPSIESTLCFRRFRTKHTELSKLYWFHILNSDISVNHANTLTKSASIASQVNPSFKPGMFPLTVKEYLLIKDQYINRTRMHMLLICSANLETYLNEITFAYLSSKGHITSFIELDEIGKALGAPILGRASIPEPLKYAEKLFDINLGKYRSDWNHFYKLRCAVAHSGGVVTPRVKKEIPSLKENINDHIGIEWKDLFKALNAADQIVTRIDEKVRSREIKLAEIRKELEYLKTIKCLPNHKDVWLYLYNVYGLTNTKKQFNKIILKDIYNISI